MNRRRIEEFLVWLLCALLILAALTGVRVIWDLLP